MTPKNNIVRLRLTEAEREQWSEAAGGKGKLSEWIRAVCNIASSPDLVVSAMPSELAESSGVKSNVPPPARLAIAEPDTTVPCPRWRHHRKGVYCGSCKQVN